MYNFIRAKFTCSQFGKPLENRTKIKNQREKQIKTIEKQEEKRLAILKDIDLYVNKKDNFLFLKQKQTFNELYFTIT